MACPVNTGRHSSCLGHDGRTCAPGKHGALATTAYRRTWLQRLLAQSRVAVPARAAVCACVRACTPFHMRLAQVLSALSLHYERGEAGWGGGALERRRLGSAISATSGHRASQVGSITPSSPENGEQPSCFRLPSASSNAESSACTQKASCKDRFVICFWCLCGLYSAILYL